MDQEKIGKFIKEIRKKNNLTQQEFSDIFGVTYQAVSKWENGKSIPDISILQSICKKYKVDLNNLLDVKAEKNKKNRSILVYSLIPLVIVLCFSLVFIYKNINNDFEFKTLSSSSDKFNLFGTIAYNDNRTTIYISNITYNGEVNNEEYKEIKCTLYEDVNNNKKLIDSYRYNDKEILLNDFLKNVNFNINHYSKKYNIYKDNNLCLEIEAINSNNNKIFYKIPLVSNSNCN